MIKHQTPPRNTLRPNPNSQSATTWLRTEDLDLAAATAITAIETTVEARARQSLGVSNDAIYRTVQQWIEKCHAGGGTLLDVGCGTGNLWRHVHHNFERYHGADVVRYPGFPVDADFTRVDFDNAPLGLPDALADVVAALETIEHLENPRGFMRELTRLCRPNGLIIVTTPNQLSLLSKLTLVVKNQFNAFQQSSYPAHLTALLEMDLKRIANECRLANVVTDYTRQGRFPGTKRHFPHILAKVFPRGLSDNLILIARKPVI